MSNRKQPRYPIYVPSKSRWKDTPTLKILERDEVPYFLVVEPHQVDDYREAWPNAEILELPFRDRGSVIPARNWIKQHATDAGYARHWQLDDNIKLFYRRWKGQRLPARAGISLRVCEDLTDKYVNVAISGLQYAMFAPEGSPVKPFVTNCHVYSCSLINNQLDYWFRGKYNEDTDYCLQVLSDGWCTILLNAFLADKEVTLKRSGGNTESLYTDPDGRLKMARSLERRWPGVVETKRRFGRAQHVVYNSWKNFKHPLIRAEDAGPQTDYGMKLTKVKEIKSPELRKLVEGAESD